MNKHAMLGCLLLSIPAASGCGDPTRAEVCGNCKDQLEAQCEEDYQVCLEADEAECFDAIEEFYAREC